MIAQPTTQIRLNRYRTDQQARFVGTSAHFAAFVGGIGSGKSYGGCVRGLMASQGYIGSQQRIPTPNLGVITAPTYTMLRDATLRTFMDVAGGAVREFNKNEYRAVMQNGSEVLFRSTDNPEHLRGPNIAWAMLDEAALSTANTWDIMIGRLRQFGQLGYLWLVTTPKGRNWIWQKFVQNLRPERRLFRASSKDNLALDQSILDAWESEYVGDFARQELEGEFVAFEGLIYPEFNRALHVSSNRPESFNQVVAGVDWGFTNPGVIWVSGVDSDRRMYGIYEAYQRQKRVEEWVNTAKELRDIYGIQRFFCDPSEPNYIKAFVDAGCRAEAANNDVNHGIQRVKSRLVRRDDGLARLTMSSDFAWTISEFDQYQWKPAKSGGYADEPMKVNDHAMDALRYAVMGVDAGLGRGKFEMTTARYA